MTRERVLSGLLLMSRLIAYFPQSPGSRELYFIKFCVRGGVVLFFSACCICCYLQEALLRADKDGQRRGFLRPAGPPGGGAPEGELPPEEGAGGQLQPPVQTGDGDVRHEGQCGPDLRTSQASPQLGGF